MYEDIYDAKTAVDGLSGFNVANRYLIVLYYNTSKQSKKVSSPDSSCTAASENIGFLQVLSEVLILAA